VSDKILTSNLKDCTPVVTGRGHGSVQLATYYVELFLLKRFDAPPPPRLSIIAPFIVYKRCRENNRKEMKYNDSHTFLSSTIVYLTPICLLIITF
jgi:hypothetical protein